MWREMVMNLKLKRAGTIISIGILPTFQQLRHIPAADVTESGFK
jgi:hypothetical protein